MWQLTKTCRQQNLVVRTVCFLVVLTLTVIGTTETGQAMGGSPQSATTPSTQTTTQSSKTTSRILYHGGKVATGVQDLYFIFYGDWTTRANTQLILTDLASTLGNTPYLQINAGYTDANGNAASSAIVYGGSVLDGSYSHSATLTQADLADIIAQQITSFALPQDPQGIYIVFTSPDVTVVDGATQFCLTCCQLHGRSMINGAMLNWGFVGHTARCTGACGIQSYAGTPNGDVAGDSMASWLAKTLSEIVTNPDTVSGWFDRYGLENGDKCVGTYGSTYQTANGALANLKLGIRDFLLQQNWVRSTSGKEHCGMRPQ